MGHDLVYATLVLWLVLCCAGVYGLVAFYRWFERREQRRANTARDGND